MRRITDGIEFFRSNDGAMFAYGRWGRPLFFSPNGLVFYELRAVKEDESFVWNEESHALVFEDSRDCEINVIRRLGDEIMCEKKYHKVEGYPEIEVVPLPEAREPEYLFVLPDDRYLYVSADKYDRLYGSFRLFVGPREAMRRIPVKDVTRLRDGSTTYIRTHEGTLFSPSPLSVGSWATWDGIKLTRVDPSQFAIVEKCDFVFITMRPQ